MFNRLIKYTKNRKYYLVHNGERINFLGQRVKGLKEYINLIAKSPEIKENVVFFTYNEPNFASFGMSEPIDLVWVDWDGKIIHLEEGFGMNKISKDVENTKFIYIMALNSIKRNKILVNDTLIHRYDRKKSEYTISDFI